MIARLAITPMALAEVSLGGGRGAKQGHERLLKMVNTHGAVVFPDDEAAIEFLKFLRDPKTSLPPGVAKRWEAMLIAFRKGSRMWAERPPLSPPLRLTGDLSTLGQSWAGAVDVVVVDEGTGPSLGISDEHGWLLDDGTGLEAAYPDAVDTCAHLSRIAEFQGIGNIPNGTPREVFWDQVIMPIWRSSKRATLIDRYLLKGLRTGRGDHVEWLLDRMMAAQGARGSITLIAEAQDSWRLDPENVIDRLESICSGGRIERLKVQLVPSRDRGSHLPHDRHIRFDTNAVILHAGFDRLSQDRVKDHYGMNWEYRWTGDALAALRAAEERAISVRGVRTAERVF